MTDVTQPERSLQPLLHDLVSTVAAPALLLSGTDGQVRPGGVQGWYVADRRLLSRLELSVDGSGLDVVRSGEHTTSYVARSLGDPIADPTVRLDVIRTLTADRLELEVVVESTAQEPVEVTLRIEAEADEAPMSLVKQGGTPTAHPVALEADPEPGPDGAWRLRLGRGERAHVRAGLSAPEKEPLWRSGRPAPWGASVTAADPDLRRTVEQGLRDLEGLLLTDETGDRFVAAGSPWFLTLFGRDSLWTARMLVPFDTGLALSTLRVLARRQGVRDDPETEEQPGKILHEVRAGELDLGEQVVLPPVYFGSIDATPLWVLTLADAADWGADPAQVRELLPALRGCLEWQLAQSGESGWLRYVDRRGGRGLTNQGWKDSHDSVQHADGTLAEAPVALVEVQAYAYEAAVRGAALLAAYDEEPVAGLAAWADDLRARFGPAYWVQTPEGGHPAIALDGAGAQVGSLTSNIGHVLGAGVLDPAHVDRVARVLAEPRLDAGSGLRTLAADSPRFSRLSYHGGAVWPHDTAIAVRGLAAEGHRETAAHLAAGLFRAAPRFGFRLPELYGGDADGPSDYPAACRPQAWAAAAPLAALVAVAGVRVEAGVVRHPERTSTALGAWSLHGLRMGERSFDLHVEADGEVRVANTTLRSEAFAE